MTTPLHPTESLAGAIGLAALEQRLQQDLQWLCLPAKRWTLPVSDEPTTRDVLIIGAGMTGLTLLANLGHHGIDAVAYDQSPPGLEGPWATTARMETLRSPKELTGPCLGLPALTFQAWFRAQFGDQAWDTLDKIPRLQWMDYLRWYRAVLNLPVQNHMQLTQVDAQHSDYVVAHFNDSHGKPHQVQTRHLVLATGRDGLGGPWLPDWAQHVPPHQRAHSSDPYDAQSLANKRVVIIGAGASAMDSAATALEAGALQVQLLIRRSDLPRVNKSKGAGSAGMAYGFWQLSDEWKWRWRHYINQQQVPPPRGSTLRVSRHDNAQFLFNTQVQAVDTTPEGALALSTSQGLLQADFIIFCTGFRTDWAQRPEFASFAQDVRIWADRYTPPADAHDPELAESPDLGPLFEFQPRHPNAAAGLSRIHAFSYAATLSHGAVAGDIPQVSIGAQRLTQGLAARLLADDAQRHFARMQAYDELELLGDEWTPARFPSGSTTA